MVTVSSQLQQTLDSLKDPEIAKDWEEFTTFVKSFRTHMFFGSIAVTGIGLFTTVYSMLYFNSNKHLLPVGIAGIITTLLGTGMTVDMVAHLYYG